MNDIYLTEITKTDWLQMLDEYRDKEYTPYSDDFDFWPDWLFQYYNEQPFVESIESDYITWKPEKHSLTPKYDILSSLLLPVKKYFVTMEKDDNQFKITCQRCNSFVTCKVRIG